MRTVSGDEAFSESEVIRRVRKTTTTTTTRVAESDIDAPSEYSERAYRVVRNKPPKFLNELLDIEVLENSTAKFDSRVTGRPAPQIRWFSDGIEIHPGGRYTLHYDDQGHCSMTIINVTRDDSAEIECRAVNAAGEEASSFADLIVKPIPQAGKRPRRRREHQTLLIHGQKPKIISELKSTQVTEGHTAKFVVKVSGTPRPSVTWYKNGRSILSNDRVVITYEEDGTCTLIIKNVCSDDDAEYMCKAVNELGKTITYADLIVETTSRERYTTIQEEPEDETWTERVEKVVESDTESVRTITTTTTTKKVTTVLREGQEPTSGSESVNVEVRPRERSQIPPRTTHQTIFETDIGQRTPDDYNVEDYEVIREYGPRPRITQEVNIPMSPGQQEVIIPIGTPSERSTQEFTLTHQIHPTVTEREVVPDQRRPAETPLKIPVMPPRRPVDEQLQPDRRQPADYHPHLDRFQPPREVEEDFFVEDLHPQPLTDVKLPFQKEKAPVYEQVSRQIKKPDYTMKPLSDLPVPEQVPYVHEPQLKPAGRKPVETPVSFEGLKKIPKRESPPILYEAPLFPEEVVQEQRSLVEPLERMPRPQPPARVKESPIPSREVQPEVYIPFDQLEKTRIKEDQITPQQLRPSPQASFESFSKLPKPQVPEYPEYEEEVQFDAQPEQQYPVSFPERKPKPEVAVKPRAKQPTHPGRPQVMEELQDTEATVGEETQLHTIIIGLPRPRIQWLRNGRPIDGDRFETIVQEDGTCILVIKIVLEEDQTVYECRATNPLGTVSSFGNLTVTTQETTTRRTVTETVTTEIYTTDSEQEQYYPHRTQIEIGPGHDRRTFIPPRQPRPVSSSVEISPEDRTETMTTTTVTETITRYEDDTLSDITTQRSEYDMYPEYERPSQEIELIIDGVRPHPQRQTATIQGRPREPEIRERTTIDIDRQAPLAPVEFIIDTREDQPQEEYETITRRKKTTVTEQFATRRDYEEDQEPIEKYSIEYPQEPRRPVDFSFDLPTPSSVDYSEEEILPRYIEPLKIDVDIPETYEICPGVEDVQQPTPIEVQFEQEPVEEITLGPEEILPVRRERHEPIELTFSQTPVEEIDLGSEKVLPRKEPKPIELTFEGAEVEEISLGPEEVLPKVKPKPQKPIEMKFDHAPVEEITLGPERVPSKPYKKPEPFQMEYKSPSVQDIQLREEQVMPKPKPQPIELTFAHKSTKEIYPGEEVTAPQPEIPLQPEFEELVIPSEYAPDIPTKQKTFVKQTIVQEVHPQPSKKLPTPEERGRSVLELETQPQPREIELILDLHQPDDVTRTYTETVTTETTTVTEHEEQPNVEYEELVIPGEPERPRKPTQKAQKKQTEPIYVEESDLLPEESIPGHSPLSPEDLPFARAAVTRIPPEVMTAPHDVEVSYGDTARLECQITGEPQPLARWNRDGTPVTGNRYLTLVERDGRVVLVINPVEEVDDTEFECVATNEEGTVSTYADVYVQDIPTEKVKSRTEKRPKRTEKVSVSVKPKRRETAEIEIDHEEDRPLKSFEVTVDVPKPLSPEDVQQRPRGPADVPVQPMQRFKPEKPEFEVLVIPKQPEEEEESITISESVTTVVETKEVVAPRETTQILIDQKRQPLAPIELTLDVPKEEEPEYEVLVVPEVPEEESVTTVTEIVTTVVETEEYPDKRETTKVQMETQRTPLAPVELTFEAPRHEQPEYEEIVFPAEKPQEQPEYEVCVIPVEETVTTVVETQEIPETRETTQVLLEKKKKPLAPVELTFDIPKEEKPEYEVLVIPQERQPEEETVTTVEEIVTTVVETQEIPETRETTQVLLEKGKKPLAPVELTFDIPKEEKPEYEVLVIPQERQPEEETVTTVEEIVTTVVETQEIPETRETTQVLLQKKTKPLAPVELTFDIPKEEKPEYEVLVIPQERQAGRRNCHNC